MKSVSAQDVKNLRDRTGSGVMDAKAALQESSGDVDKAIEILRVKGQASAAKRGERVATEGAVASYIHAGGKIGALVEVDCETDFEITVFANSITLTPGTISVHVEREQRKIIIHALDVGDDPEAVRRDVKQTLEANILKWTRPTGWPPSAP